MFGSVSIGFFSALKNSESKDPITPLTLSEKELALWLPVEIPSKLFVRADPPQSFQNFENGTRIRHGETFVLSLANCLDPECAHEPY